MCTGAATPSPGNPSAVIDSKDPFYSSTSPQLYAIGCMTVVSYVLVIILLITPRTFYIGGPGGGGTFLGRHGGSYGGSPSVVGVGGRPWLQKVAALSVAVSLTIATVDSFRVAEEQYNYGYMDATALTNDVINGTEIRVVRVISSTFLWLAQVQTLIRLFPRHKEKVMIKWAGFALIVLDTIFAILDNFVAHGSSTRPRLFDDAIPALSYLFELALNLLYAAWVIFYSLSKHRFAFFHPKMRNICLVALLSLVAVFIPVVFFIMDISQPDVAGWGEYIRWVGSAAASVVVWEWVERIEALERDERKDGILGREIFDGDEMLEVTPSEEIDWPRQPGGGDHGNESGQGTATSTAWGGVRGLSHRPLRRTRVGFQRSNRARRDGPGSMNYDNVGSTEPHRTGPVQPTPPPAAVTPVSRADTTSAASTVYYVRYHPVTSPTPPAQPAAAPQEDYYQPKEVATTAEDRPSSNSSHSLEMGRSEGPWSTMPRVQDARWFSIANLFRRRRTSPPQEVATAQEQEQSEAAETDGLEEKYTGSWNLRSRMNHILSFHRSKGAQESDGRGAARPLPVTVIPPRGRSQQTWSPQHSDDSHFYVGDSSHRTSSSQRTLPARVITTQPRRAAPWPSSAAGGGEDPSQRLRYDPDAAALVGAGPDLVLPVEESEGATRNASVRGTSSGNETLVVSDDEQAHLAGSRDNVVGAADQPSHTTGPEIQQTSTNGQPGSDVGDRGSMTNPSRTPSSVQSSTPRPSMPEHSSVAPAGPGNSVLEAGSDPAGHGRRP